MWNLIGIGATQPRRQPGPRLASRRTEARGWLLLTLSVLAVVAGWWLGSPPSFADDLTPSPSSTSSAVTPSEPSPSSPSSSQPSAQTPDPSPSSSGPLLSAGAEECVTGTETGCPYAFTRGDMEALSLSVLFVLFLGSMAVASGWGKG